MIVTDLDRTLLRDDKTISADSADVLKQCRERGLRVVFATARLYRMVEEYVHDVPVDAVIGINGAGIWIDGERRVHHSIPADTAVPVLQTLHRRYPEKTLSYERDDQLHVNFDLPIALNRKEPAWIDFDALPMKDMDCIIAHILNEPHHVDEIVQMLPESMYGHVAAGKLLHIMDRRATKRAALIWLGQQWNIPSHQMVAFGDDNNDVAMLRFVGWGVAVDNALQVVKDAADEICPSNSTDGVAHWLNEHIIKA